MAQPLSERFSTPAQPLAAQLLSLIRAIISAASAYGFCQQAEEGPVGLLTGFLKTVDSGARRKIFLGRGEGATGDEIALVNLIAEAQTGDRAALRARAAWLVRRGHIEPVILAATRAADAFASVGVHFERVESSLIAEAEPETSVALGVHPSRLDAAHRSSG